MRAALELAQKACEQGEVPVGAVVVYQDSIVGTGYNRRERSKNALAHAELEAIHQACENLGGWRLSGCTLYVTLEPCPMCTGAIINSRIDRVVFGATDKKAGSCGTLVNLFDFPYNHSPNITMGILQDECSRILTDFFVNMRKKRGKRKWSSQSHCFENMENHE